MALPTRSFNSALHYRAPEFGVFSICAKELSYFVHVLEDLKLGKDYEEASGVAFNYPFNRLN
jgi:hypothetical protein